MDQAAWDQIKAIYHLPGVSSNVVEKFEELKNKQSVHTREEGVAEHYCSFFLPYDQAKGKIYLGHHIKAQGWIPPGGHIEPGETPMDAAIREMEEELKVRINQSDLTPFNLTVTHVNHPPACLVHYDVWHTVNIAEQDFEFDRGEYYDAAWFDIPAAAAQITHTPDFATVIKNVQAWSTQASDAIISSV